MSPSEPTTPSFEKPRFPFVVVDVPPDDADVASATLFDLGADGIEERDASTLIKGAVGRTTLVASFATHELAKEATSTVDASWNPRIEEVVGDEWRDEWKKYFVPFEVCPGIVIRPPWQSYEPKSHEQVIVLEPGRAFGTGLHETTMLVAHALHSHREAIANREVLDVGAGSGILSLIALTLGASRARGTEIDADAVHVAVENADRNGLSEAASFEARADLPQGRFPTVVANIEAPTLIAMKEALVGAMAPGALLVLSGVLKPQRDEVVRAFSNLELLGTPEKGEWIAVVLRAKAA
jgi:ribosomal protein L11 methyltransferase